MSEKQAAKYQVTVAPGAPVPGVGFVAVGSIFTAPSEDYVPSRTFRAANEEAKGPLEKVYAQEKERLEGAKKAAAASPIDQQIAQLEADKQERLKVLEPPQDAPKVEEGMSLGELDAISRGVPPEPLAPAQAEHLTPAQAKAQAKADKAEAKADRAADKQ